MKELTNGDYELIELLKEQLKKNSDYNNAPFTSKASMLKCKDGKVYPGINLALWHGACAEEISIGSAIANGSRDFDVMVCGGYDKETGEFEIITSCGNCRQIMQRHCENIDCIIEKDGKYFRISIDELLPFSYQSNTAPEV